MGHATPLLPETIDGPDGLLLRRWQVEDAEALSRAVAESVGHLKPWMAWAAQEPLPLNRRRELIEEWNHRWAEGGEVILGVFLDGRIVGGCGLHRRIGPSGLEIGYWIHPRFLRQGLATEAAARLTDAALDLPDIRHVEIQHDKANVASAGVPRKLGFHVIAEVAEPPEAPAETGIRLRWRMDHATWGSRRRNRIREEAPD